MCVLEDLYRRYGGQTPEEQAAEQLRVGRELLDEKEYRKAIPCFECAEKQLNHAAEALEGKLKALFALEAYDDADRCIAQALREFPQNTVAYRYKALLLAREDRTEDAIACLDRIIALSPSDENAYLTKSELLVKQGDFRRAGEVAEILLEKHPDSEAANFQAAKAFFGLREYDRAIGLFGKVAEMNPANVAAASGRDDSLEKYRRSEKNDLKLALTLLDNRMYADSLRYFGQMIARGQDTAEVHYFLGKAYRGMGDTAHMIESMERAHQLAPHSPAPYIEIAEHLLSEGQEKQAMEYFDRVLETDPSNRIANIRRGEYLQRHGQPGQADKYYDRILDQDNKDAEAYLMKGITAMDRYPAAGNPMLYFDKAMEINPAYALPMYYRGKFQLLSGQKKRYALESFNKAAFLAAMSSETDLLEKCRQAIGELADQTED